MPVENASQNGMLFAGCNTFRSVVCIIFARQTKANVDCLATRVYDLLPALIIHTFKLINMLQSHSLARS